jgi:hypothetical protein
MGLLRHMDGQGTTYPSWLGVPVGLRSHWLFSQPPKLGASGSLWEVLTLLLGTEGNSAPAVSVFATGGLLCSFGAFAVFGSSALGARVFA